MKSYLRYDCIFFRKRTLHYASGLLTSSDVFYVQLMLKKKNLNLFTFLFIEI